MPIFALIPAYDGVPVYDGAPVCAVRVRHPLLIQGRTEDGI